VGWTKRQLVGEAFSEIGIAGWEFDVEPEELDTALRRLDTMLATWAAKGVCVGYLFPSGADKSDLDDDSGLPDSACETVYLNLAIRIAPSFGKQVGSDTRRSARAGYDTLLLTAAMPQQQQFPNTLPRGAGNKAWRNINRPFFPTPDDDPVQIGDGGDLDFLE
jgi:hypothetical protein